MCTCVPSGLNYPRLTNIAVETDPWKTIFLHRQVWCPLPWQQDAASWSVFWSILIYRFWSFLTTTARTVCFERERVWKGNSCPSHPRWCVTEWAGLEIFHVYIKFIVTIFRPLEIDTFLGGPTYIQQFLINSIKFLCPILLLHSSTA